MAEAPIDQPLNLLLLGKTGNGKSATGNTILQKRVFVERPGGESVTKGCELGGGMVAGRQIYVLDTPGCMDTKNPEEALKTLAEAIFKLQNCIDGIIIVLSYTLRMTNDEISTIEKMEELFGSEIFDFVVFAFTHADNYEAYKERAEEERSLEEFVLANGGEYLVKILRRCKNRFVGTNNYAKEIDLPIESLKIVTAVDEMIKDNRGRRYQSQYLMNENLYEMESLRLSLPTGLNLEEGARRKAQIIEQYDRQISSPSPKQFINNDVLKEDLEKGVEYIVQEMYKSKAECFPANALVKVTGRGHVKLKNLAVGDKVMTLDNNMKVLETEIYIFGHAFEKCKATFINIQTRNCKLRATPGHLIYIYTEEGKSTKAAREITPGDKLLTVNCKGQCVIEEVRAIWESEEEGLFAPFTLSGSLVVDGVLVSCYVDVLPDSVAHLLLEPVRMMYRCSPSTLVAVSKKGQDGIPGWMRWCLDQLL